MPSALQKRARLLVVARGRDDGDVHPARLVHLVEIDLGEDELVAHAERVVAAPVERLRARRRGSRARAAARRETSRSRNSYIRSPRSVTIVPMGMPWRSLNAAMDFLARVVTGFWPVTARSSSAAVSTILALAMASPSPMLMTIFSSRGIAIGFVMPNSLAIAGAISFVVTLFQSCCHCLHTSPHLRLRVSPSSNRPRAFPGMRYRQLVCYSLSSAWPLPAATRVFVPSSATS